jgi:phenylalanyl-tRNA synthetase alpha chain
MIANKTWTELNFKKFNPEAKGPEVENGNLHILMKTRQQFKEILTDMGFE